MLNEYWGLRHSPFEASADAGSFYPSRSHDEALARMAFLVDHRRRVGALTGAAGIGKSYVLGLFARQVQRRGARVAGLSLSGVPAHEIAWELADRLGVAEGGSQGPRLWRRLREHLQENTAQGLHTLVLIDDADAPPASPPYQGGERGGCATALDRLARLDSARQCDFTLIVTIQTRAGVVGEWLTETADLWISLMPLDLQETAGYVAHRWRCAGGGEVPFDEGALRRLHALCGGVPRRINQLCDLALVAAMGEGTQVISTELVDSVREQLCAPMLEYDPAGVAPEFAVGLVS